MPVVEEAVSTTTASVSTGPIGSLRPLARDRYALCIQHATEKISEMKGFTRARFSEYDIDGKLLL